jgi:hypothetical protein
VESEFDGAAPDGIQREICMFMESQFILNFNGDLNPLRFNGICIADIKDDKSNRLLTVMSLKNILKYSPIRIGFFHVKASNFISYKFLSKLF